MNSLSYFNSKQTLQITNKKVETEYPEAAVTMQHNKTPIQFIVNNLLHDFLGYTPDQAKTEPVLSSTKKIITTLLEAISMAEEVNEAEIELNLISSSGQAHWCTWQINSRGIQLVEVLGGSNSSNYAEAEILAFDYTQLNAIKEAAAQLNEQAVNVAARRVAYGRDNVSSISNEYEETYQSFVFMLADTEKIEECVTGHILNNSSRYTSAAAIEAACAVIEEGHEDDEDQIDRAVTYISQVMRDRVNKYAMELMQKVVTCIVRDRYFFTTDVVEMAFNHVGDHVKKYSEAKIPFSIKTELLIDAAQMFINRNRAFFEAPLGSFENQKKFEDFYEKNQKRAVIEDYSKSFGEALTSDTQAIFVRSSCSSSESLMQTRKFYIGREPSSEPKGKKKVSSKEVPFFEDKKLNNSALSYTNKNISIHTLWLEGEFEAALHANIEIAEYILENKNHEAIALWNSQYEMN